jgi:uncharacterized protein
LKPLDLGMDGVTGSVNSDGRIIALNFYHPQYGYVTLTSAAPFPEDQRYNPAAVRAYRASLPYETGFGIQLDQPVTTRNAALLESALPAIELVDAAGSKTTITTFAYAQGAVQLLKGGTGARWGGTLCLQRCAYTQLTEGGPLPMPPLQMRAFAHDELLILHNPVLGAAVAIAGLDVSAFAAQESNQPIELNLRLPGASICYGVGLTPEDAVINARWLTAHTNPDGVTAEWHNLTHNLPDDPLLRRAIVYGRMMAILVGEGVCLLTDHMLLPLSWNRDAYFAARALLSAGQPEIVRRHLLWTFETAQRQDGIWARCYLANGGVKDGAYQLDQQIYPLLELAEYLLETDDEATAARLMPQIEAVLAVLEARRKPDSLLFSTDETPADDPIALPYHFSSHILLWHTLNKLNKLGAAGTWSERITVLPGIIAASFTAEHKGNQIYAYATDGAGRFHFYHDANDFPLALAPSWGFATPEDPVWRATVDFAFSPSNSGGFYDGHLGSVHSSAPWALGDVQELLIARAIGDAARAERAKASLQRIASFDGALPEAYDSTTDDVFSRTWFLWPSAAYACAELGAFET